MICQYLGITTEFYFSSEKYHNSNLYAEDRILDICKKENAKSYINPALGIALYKAENFKRSNIDLHFINTGELFYNQNGKYFVPHLSIIDTMMFCSVDDIKDMLKLYKLS